MMFVLGLVGVLGLVTLVSGVAGFCAYCNNDDKTLSLAGGIGCSSFGVGIILAAVSTANFDWQAYVIPVAFFVAGILYFVDAYRRHVQAS